jgi:hypothetical protein
VPGAERASTGGARLALKACFRVLDDGGAVGCELAYIGEVLAPVAAQTAATHPGLSDNSALLGSHLAQGSEGTGPKHISNIICLGE